MLMPTLTCPERALKVFDNSPTTSLARGHRSSAPSRVTPCLLASHNFAHHVELPAPSATTRDAIQGDTDAVVVPADAWMCCSEPPTQGARSAQRVRQHGKREIRKEALHGTAARSTTQAWMGTAAAQKVGELDGVRGEVDGAGMWQPWRRRCSGCRRGEVDCAGMSAALGYGRGEVDSAGLWPG